MWATRVLFSAEAARRARLQRTTSRTMKLSTRALWLLVESMMRCLEALWHRMAATTSNARGLSVTHNTRLDQIARRILSAQPDLFALTIRPEDEFLIVASDGVWDVLTNQKACDIVLTDLIRSGGAPEQAARALVDAAYAAESEDNISAAVMLLGQTRGAMTQQQEAAASTPAQEQDPYLLQDGDDGLDF